MGEWGRCRAARAGGRCQLPAGHHNRHMTHIEAAHSGRAMRQPIFWKEAMK
jgi:hypothetical protein